MFSVTSTPSVENPRKTPFPHQKKWKGVLGPRELVTSSTILRRLEMQGNSPAAARKILERDFTNSGVWQSLHFRMEAGARLYCSKSFYGESAFLSKLRPILRKRRKGIARVLDAIFKFDALDIDTVKKLTAIELDAKGKGTFLKRELSAIEEVGLGRFDNSGTHRQRLVRLKELESDENLDLAVELLVQREAEQHWLKLVLDQLRRNNMVAWNSSCKHGEIFNNHYFTAKAFSFLRPLTRFQNQKPVPCPTVFEILNRKAEVFDVEGFIERMFRAGANNRRKLRMLGLIGAPSFSPEAFELARGNGLIVINFRENFGEVALELMVSAEQLLTVCNETVHHTPRTTEVASAARRFTKSIRELRNHPMITTLSGLAFEALCCAVLRSSGYEGVETGLRVPFLDKEKKATAFLRAKGKNNISECRAEIWTTGTIGAEAKTCLAEIKLNPRVKPAILTKEEIPIPQRLKPFNRMLQVLAAI